MRVVAALLYSGFQLVQPSWLHGIARKNSEEGSAQQSCNLSVLSLCSFPGTVRALLVKNAVLVPVRLLLYTRRYLKKNRQARAQAAPRALAASCLRGSATWDLVI